MTASSIDIINASQDNNVLQRLIAIGSTFEEPISQGDIEMRRTRLAAAPVDSDGNTVASVFAFALASYEPIPAPGEDTSKLTDNQLKHALSTVFDRN